MKNAVELADPHPVLGSTAVFQTFQYAPGVTASGRLLFIAGQVGIAADGSIPDDAGAQADLAFGRMGAILDEVGLDFADLVDLTTYHVDIGTTLVATKAAKERHIMRDFPAWTIIGVAALARPVFLFEVKAIAAFRE